MVVQGDLGVNNKDFIKLQTVMVGNSDIYRDEQHRFKSKCLITDEVLSAVLDTVSLTYYF